MLNRVILAASSLIFISACTTGAKKSDALQLKNNEKVEVALASDTSKRYVCEKSMKTGSRLIKKRCWEKEQYEAHKKRSREMLERVKNNSTISGRGVDL